MTRTIIRNELHRRNMSMLKLSKETGIRYPTITEFLNNNKGISVKHLEKVLEILDIVLIPEYSLKKKLEKKKS